MTNEIKERLVEKTMKDMLETLSGVEKYVLVEKIVDLQERIDKAVDDLEQKNKEIVRLNKIIYELEEYIQLKIIRSENESDYIIDEGDIKELYYKLQELKEEGK